MATAKRKTQTFLRKDQLAWASRRSMSISAVVTAAVKREVLRRSEMSHAPMEACYVHLYEEDRTALRRLAGGVRGAYSQIIRDAIDRYIAYMEERDGS